LPSGDQASLGAAAQVNCTSGALMEWPETAETYSRWPTDTARRSATGDKATLAEGFCDVGHESATQAWACDQG
jgi:hypothetical protein